MRRRRRRAQVQTIVRQRHMKIGCSFGRVDAQPVVTEREELAGVHQVDRYKTAGCFPVMQNTGVGLVIGYATCSVVAHVRVAGSQKEHRRTERVDHASADRDRSGIGRCIDAVE